MKEWQRSNSFFPTGPASNTYSGNRNDIVSMWG